MWQRIISLITLVFWLTSSLLAHAAQVSVARAADADWFYVSPDLDGDGLINTIEEGGWCNAVGCFQTNPLDADSDDDGLTDGEEKLFEANPLSDASPGIYAIYRDEFKTKEYYPWQPYGHRMIARGDSFTPPNPDKIDRQQGHGNDLDAIVVRRGTTFYVGGPLTAPLVITKNDPVLSDDPDGTQQLLTDLTPIRDPYSGQWQITIPPDGTVGHYDLTLAGKSLDLYVIFEFPILAGELTQQALDRFLYDDDPNLDRDNVSIMVATREYPTKENVSKPPYHDQLDGDTYFISEGWSYKFQNQQFNRFMLEEYVIPAINGETNQKDAATEVAWAADQETVFQNPHPRFSSFNVLNPGANVRQQCSNVAGLLTSFSRAAGIPARAFEVDWHKTSNFDVATEIWVNNQWRSYRGYYKDEMDSSGPIYSGKCQSQPWRWPACGQYVYKSPAWWGFNIYYPWHSGWKDGSSNIIVTALDDWTYPGDPQLGKLDWSFDYRWPSWEIHSIVKNERRLQTLNSKYWSDPRIYGDTWAEEPQVQKVFTSLEDDWPEWYGGLILNDPTTILSVNSSDPSLDRTNNDDTTPTSAIFGQIVDEYGVDTNGNGQYDQLVLEVEVTVSQAGDYWLQGRLITNQADLEPTVRAAGGAISEAVKRFSLTEGSQIVKLIFDGTDFSLSRVDGPYLLNDLLITDAEAPDTTDFVNNSLDHLKYTYITNAYQAADFETYGATLSGNYSHSTKDSDGDGQSDTLVVTTDINIDQPGLYTVEGSLFDAQDEFISHASWSGTGSNVTLNFDNVAGTAGPYSLQSVNLLNEQDQTIDFSVDAYTIPAISALTEAGLISFDIPAPSGGLGTLDAKFPTTKVFNEYLDNGNLKIEADVNVTSSSSNYRLEAWLVDVNGDLVTWASGPTTNLSVGTHTLAVTFDGNAIRAHGVDGPYQVVALKVIRGNNYNVRDSVDVALTTQAYTLDQFALDPGITVNFEDFMEDGGSQWTQQSPWAINQTEYFTAHAGDDSNHAWYGTNANAILQLASPLNFSEANLPAMRFQSSHKFGTNGDTGYLEASTDGNNWDILATFSDDAYWSTELIDLGAYAGQPQVYLRFRLDSAAGAPADGWYIDDVRIVSVFTGTQTQPVDEVSFTYSPVPPIENETVTFTTAITPFNATRPITYIWDFGDGSDPVGTTANTINHTFAAAGSYTVMVTATNGYGSPVVYSEIVTVVAGPVIGVTLIKTGPPSPQEGDVVSFEAQIDPANATQPVIYTWNFGDNSPEVETTTNTTTHIFNTVGGYTVMVTASNDYGSANDSLQVGIGGIPVTDVSLSKTGPATPVEGDVVSFEAQIDPVNATQPVIYTWNFGDNSPEVETTTNTTTHIFNTVGDYTIVVTASNDYGSANDSLLLSIEGIPLTDISFVYGPNSPQEGEVVSFSTTISPVNATEPVTYTWDFDDGGVPLIMTADAGGDAVQHSFAQGIYTVVVMATNGYGLPVVYSDTVVITARPNQGVAGDIYLPIIMAFVGPAPPPPPTYPDLIVQDIVATTSGGVQVTIVNQGTAPVNNEFWVDFYVDPNPIPTGVNETWDDGRSTYGIAWGVTASALPSLTPGGGSLTLTIGDAYYWPSLSNYPASLSAGTPVYVQVDSANIATNYGGVRESHEANGGTYNNIKAGQVIIGATGQRITSTAGGDQQLDSRDGLPSR